MEATEIHKSTAHQCWRLAGRGIFRRVCKQIAEEGQVAINIASAGHGEAEQAGCKGSCGSDGQDGQPAKCEGGGACCARKGRHGPIAAPGQQADKDGCFGTPPATDFDAGDSEMAAPGGSRYARSLARRATWKVVPALRPPRRRGLELEVGCSNTRTATANKPDRCAMYAQHRERINFTALAGNAKCAKPRVGSPSVMAND